jgi:hypothetical protein
MFTLDHGVVYVRDLAAAATAYRRLGFQLTPRGEHPSLGTANHTMMFERDYLELITVVTTGPASSRWARSAEGVAGVALRTRDAREARETLIGRGFDCPPVVDFERPVALPGGTVAARFSVCHLPVEATPVLAGFFCQHHTPEHVWRPEYLRHPNTALGLVAITVVHPEPESVSEAYARLLGRASVHPHAGGIALDLGNTRIWVVSPGYAIARLERRLNLEIGAIRPLGLTISVRDLTTVRRVLSAEGLPFHPFGRRSIVVEPTWTQGVYLEFLSA